MGRKRNSTFRVRQWLRQLAQKTMPRTIRHAMLRQFLSLDLSPSPRLKVRLARSQSDLEAALKLLHDSYVGAGFMDPHLSGMRVTKYHSLPATSTIVALWDDEIVGTLSLVRRSAFGMPLESIFDISHLTEDGSRIFETSSLAVHPKFTGQHGKILFPLIKFLFDYGINFFGSNYMAIAVNPAWIEFYEAVFKFQRLSAKTVDNYSFVKGAPAVGAYISLDNIAETLKKVYKNAPPEKNLFEYLFNLKLANLEFPDRKFTRISDPILTPELIDHFFNQRTQTFATMSEREIFTLHQLYQNENFRKVLPPQPKISNLFQLRDGMRIEVNLSGRLLIPGHPSIPIVVTDLSKNGLGIVSERNLREGQLYTLEVSVDGVDHLLHRTQVRWYSSNQQRWGLHVTNPPSAWQNFVTLLQDNLLQKAG